ncbi:hypothetical protein F2Q70_00020065 [Brassica cretica]|uniref:Uncharacterized protein n=1 Tax=Brassica cretica TaxID=69181 RepID=A0A8S9GV53_BRACR|nr:hypothetical protein F2Q70_00020065 [Brassica cretica]
MSLLRQVLQALLQHDPRTPPRASLSLSIRSASVSLSLYRRPHSYLIVILHVPETLVSKATFINLLLKFIPLSISPRYFLALQVYTTPAQHLDSTWSSPFNPTSTSAITSVTTSVQTSYIFTSQFPPSKERERDDVVTCTKNKITKPESCNPYNFHKNNLKNKEIKL